MKQKSTQKKNTQIHITLTHEHWVDDCHKSLKLNSIKCNNLYCFHQSNYKHICRLIRRKKINKIMSLSFATLYKIITFSDLVKSTTDQIRFKLSFAFRICLNIDKTKKKNKNIVIWKPSSLLKKNSLYKIIQSEKNNKIQNL